MLLSHAVILSVVQGITEFVPVSSSAHLIIFADVLGWKDHFIFFDLMIHLGTGFALLVYFRKDLIAIFKNLEDWWLIVLIGTLPAAATGYFLRNWFENTFRSTGHAALFLLMGSLLMLGAEIYLKKMRSSVDDLPEESSPPVLKITNSQALIVGLFQILPLFSGFSRSGSTISGGIFAGLEREAAARFSFLLSIPLVFGAGFYELISIPLTTFSSSDLTIILVAAIISFVTGLISMDLLLRFLKSNSLIPFVLYRILLVVALFFFVI